MASACINNVGVSPDNFPASGKFPSCGWLNPRASFSREDDRRSGSGSEIKPKKPSPTQQTPAAEENQDPGDFEFRLDDPVAMLPADELFSDGKLVPLQFSSVSSSKQQQPVNELNERRRTRSSPEKCRRMEIEMEMEMEISAAITDGGYIFSPKAPRCSSRWKDLLGLKRFSNSSKTAVSNTKVTSSSTSSLKYLLHRSSKSSSEAFPLLKDSECESLSISSSRLSLSSSSSGHDHDDLPRLSLDSERPSLNPNLSPNPFAPPHRMRMVKSRAGRSPMRRSSAVESSSSSNSHVVMSRGVSVDSPRLNSSGKIVFQSLERSSSSPSSFNGGYGGYKQRATMERSYSANVVRVTPVLNVPVSSLRGASKSGLFGQLFSSTNGGGGNRSHQNGNASKNRMGS